MKRILTGTLAAAAVVAAGAAQAQEDTIKIGVLVTQEGVFTVPGDDSIRGFKMALEEAGGEVAGKKIEWVLGPTDATPDTAVRQARKLVEQDEVEIIIGPLSGSEGIAMRDYAKTVPDKTIVNGISGVLFVLVAEVDWQIVGLIAVGAVIGGVIVESGRFPYDNGRFPAIVEPSPAYHGLRFWENFFGQQNGVIPLQVINGTFQQVNLLFQGVHLGLQLVSFPDQLGLGIIPLPELTDYLALGLGQILLERFNLLLPVAEIVAKRVNPVRQSVALRFQRPGILAGIQQAKGQQHGSKPPCHRQPGGLLVESKSGIGPGCGHAPDEVIQCPVHP